MSRFTMVFLGLVLASLLCSFIWGSISKERKMASKIARIVAAKYEKKYGLEFCGLSEAAPEGKYENLGMDFFVYRKLSRNEGRKILLELESDFLAAINNNASFRKYMLVHPFTSHNSVISIIVRSKKGDEAYYPDYRAFSIYNDMLCFSFERKGSARWSPLEEDEETKEEALRIVAEQ